MLAFDDTVVLSDGLELTVVSYSNGGRNLIYFTTFGLYPDFLPISLRLALDWFDADRPRSGNARVLFETVATGAVVLGDILEGHTRMLLGERAGSLTDFEREVELKMDPVGGWTSLHLNVCVLGVELLEPRLGAWPAVARRVVGSQEHCLCWLVFALRFLLMFALLGGGSVPKGLRRLLI